MKQVCVIELTGAELAFFAGGEGYTQDQLCVLLNNMQPVASSIKRHLAKRYSDALHSACQEVLKEKGMLNEQPKDTQDN